MVPEEREYRDSRFEEVVADPTMRGSIYRHLSFLAEPDEPAVAPADVQAARHYLRRCMDNMSMNELAEKSRDDLAALWARGALGAARYRARERPPARTRRARSASSDDE